MVRLYSRIIYWFIGLCIVLYLLYTVSAVQKEQISSAIKSQNWKGHIPGVSGANTNGYQRENATFVTLALSKDLEKLLPAVKAMEDRFNRNYHYDWVFLNNEDFSDEFKESMSMVVSGTAKFGKIPTEHWSYPSWIDQNKAAEVRKDMKDRNIIYGDSESYRHMCRYESGFFFEHELMKQYKYYWRVEPETSILCDIDYDVFRFMREKKKRYGWTISITEFLETIPTLWDTTMQFLDQPENKKYIHKNALENFVRDEKDRSKYNLCHYWTNFEVADADFWREEAYQKLFKHYDQNGGFFYERWGDAPVHSIAVSLLMDRDEVHFFDDIGYAHPPFQHCPAFQKKKGLKCACIPKASFDWHGSSCLRTYMSAKGIPYPEDYHD